MDFGCANAPGRGIRTGPLLFALLSARRHPGSSTVKTAMVSDIWGGKRHLLSFNRAQLSAGAVYAFSRIRERLAHGQWHEAVNGYWSPLYPLLAGAATRIFHPSPPYEATVLHLVNFCIYLFALACFDFLLRRLARDGCATDEAQCSFSSAFRKIAPTFGQARSSVGLSG
jgi:hypothetical protein